jgi:hypothetical protein
MVDAVRKVRAATDPENCRNTIDSSGDAVSARGIGLRRRFDAHVTITSFQ